MTAARREVSVLMPVYNGARYLALAIESILNQTYPYFQLIVIDDGSTDETESILEQFKDPRILTLKQDHQGLIAALNKGLAAASGQYIARMDSDDISLPSRFASQVQFLDAHPDVGIVGTACHIIDGGGRLQHVQRWPSSDVHIRWALLLTSPFAHPTVMCRRDLLFDHHLAYDEAYTSAEDYDLWTRLLEHTHGANLDEPLLQYRTHGAGVTSRDRELQLKHHDDVALRTIRRRLPGVSITREQLADLRQIFVEEKKIVRTSSGMDLGEVFALYLSLLECSLHRETPSPGLRSAIREETVRVAQCMIRHAMIIGYGRLAWRLHQYNPWLPLRICEMGLKFAGRRLRKTWLELQAT